MPPSRSSIFSFSTLEPRHPQAPRLLATWLVVVLLVAASELALRHTTSDQPHLLDYWSRTAAVKWERYLARVAEGKTPELLFVGDSTGARDIDPAVVVAGLDRPVTAYNLATDGNHQFALAADTLPLLEGRYPVPRVVVYCTVLTTFFEGDAGSSEQAVVTAPIGRRLAGRRRLGDRLQLLRVRVWRDLDKGQAPMTELGFMPLDEHRKGEDVAALKRADRRGADGRPLLNPERFAVVDRLAAAAAANGFRLAVVIPPVRDDLVAENYDIYRTHLEAAARRSGFTLVDDYHAPELGPERFADRFHLDHEGARIYSGLLAERLAGLLDGAAR